MQKIIEKIRESLFQASPNAYLILSPELIIVDANTAYSLLSGYGREAVVGEPVLEVLPAQSEQHREQLILSFKRVIEHRVSDMVRLPHAGPQPGVGVAERCWHLTNVPILDDRGQVLFILNHTRDASQPLAVDCGSDNAGLPRPSGLPLNGSAASGERLRLRALMDQAPGFVAVVRGPGHVFELANKACIQLIGRRDILGKPVRDALPELEGQGFFELLNQVYSSGEAFVGRAMPIDFEQVPGRPLVTRYIDFVYQPIREADSRVSGVFVQGHDVTEAHELSRELSYQASHDSLTGLCNRKEFEGQLQRAIDDLPSAKVHSLLYLDLDQFKLVNDTCGHHAGDEFLRLISMVLSARIRPTDTLARLGGDEFGLLLEGCPGPTAERIAEELRQAINDLEFIWQDRVFGGSVSIGLVSIHDDTTGLNRALSSADSACFLAKEKGRNRIQVYHQEDDELVSRWRQMDVIGQLRTALKEEQFELYWQRIQPLTRSQGYSEYYEVLIRFRHPEGHMVPPMAFIPAAERYGLMPAIDRYVIRKVFEYLALRNREGRSLLFLSVNLSGTSLNDDGFIPFVIEMRDTFEVDTSQLCFEITETAAVANLSHTAELIKQLKQLGFAFALDDFGSGMSSFGYLKFLPVDYIKIDGVFIRNILDDEVDATMVEAIAKIAKVMGIRTVAEYVENDSVRALLAGIGVDYGQGYGIHKPEPLI